MRISLRHADRRLWIGACVAAGAAVAAYWLAARIAPGPIVESQLADAGPRDIRQIPRPERVDPALDEADANAGAEIDLDAMAERFRRAVLVTAIRDAGFLCDDVAEAVRTATDVWVASCRNMINYRVDVAEDRSLVARPVASYFDQVDTAQQLLDDRLRVDRDAPRNLPPRLREK